MAEYNLFLAFLPLSVCLDYLSRTICAKTNRP